ncbi:Down syndrome cell adhesion molecule-like protein Dscam2 [Araneus ventricosus]|uniref:Down syndrome cell adhesion molecule-like protein Dscam2 n=1 Tax=Araneus ventricosus TaxID=182803 RepID=A0A4Y2C6L5_ARAVE|nr:Down syndrome cell adhesion molecule-like protein Dscam2 [Araneus ventricosus]
MYSEGTSSKYQGPSFVHEPPNRVLFYNNTGAIIPCVTNGTPRPEVSWTTSDNITAIPIPGLRETRPDGSLVFSPFRAEDYRQDVHSATYRCSVANIVGSIVSREVHVRGGKNAFPSIALKLKFQIILQVRNKIIPFKK